MGVEALQYRAPAPPAQPPQEIQRANPQGKIEACNAVGNRQGKRKESNVRFVG